MKKPTAFNVGLMGCFKDDGWEHFLWSVSIGSERFEFRTGMGHMTKGWNRPKGRKSKEVRLPFGEIVWAHVPSKAVILHTLARDAQVGSGTFADFCSDLGYDSDSRKAFRTYEDCCDILAKMNRVMTSKNWIERICAWEI